MPMPISMPCALDLGLLSVLKLQFVRFVISGIKSDFIESDFETLYFKLFGYFRTSNNIHR